MLTIGQCATLACLLEVTAPKPGNVHRGADFDDLCFGDFVASSVAIGPVMEAAQHKPLGETVKKAVCETQKAVRTNTNLGTILLLAPLATVPRSRPLEEGVAHVLDHLTAEDATNVYEAIDLAKPGGMGTVSSMDIADKAPRDLRAAMSSAAARDMVARQYSENFAQVLGPVLAWVAEGQESGWSLTDSIVHTHVRLMDRFPDSLIARKCGGAAAKQSAMLAGRVLASGSPGEESYTRSLEELDFWLRSDGHRRNPGTSADLIAAGLFVALRNEIIHAPYK